MKYDIQISYSNGAGTAFYKKNGETIPIGGITSENIPYTHQGKWNSAQKDKKSAESKLIKMLKENHETTNKNGLEDLQERCNDYLNISPTEE